MLRQSLHALRTLVRRPFYLAAGIVIVALGVGTTTSMLAITDALLWRALPYADAERLLDVVDTNAAQGIEEMPGSYPIYERIAAQVPAFEAVGTVHTPQALVWDSPEGPRRLTAALASPSFFSITGATALEGRLFRPDEDTTPGGHPVVVLSERFRDDAFGPGVDVLGATMSVNGLALTVVGVLPRDFASYPDPTQETHVWLPIQMVAATRGEIAMVNGRYRIFRVIAKVAPGVDGERVAAELEAVSAQLAVDFPDTSAGWTLITRPVREIFLGAYTGPVTALLVGAILLMVTGWANLGNLVLLRLDEQGRELAIRSALGGTRGALVRMILGETFLLAVLGGVPGIALALSLPRLLRAALPVSLPDFVRFEPGAVVYAGAVVTIAVTGFVLAAAALVQLRRLESNATILGGGGKGQAVDQGSGRVMGALIVAEIAVSAVLLVGAGLVVRGSSTLAGIDIGFEAEDLWSLRVQLPPDGRESQEIAALTRQLRSDVAALPAVERVDIWSPHVPGTATWYTKARALSQEATPEDQLPVVRFHTVSPGAVTGIGLPLVAGRDFSEDDLTSGRRVMLVSQSYAAATWPGEDPIGKQIRRWSHTDWSTVVGVVADAPLSGRGQSQTDAFLDVYFMLSQDPQRDWVLLVRADDADPGILATLRATVARAAPDLPIYDVERMRDLTAQEQGLPRFAATLGALYAGAAGLLAAVGLYAVIAYSVTLQRASIGLRMALGAQRTTVRREVTRRGMRLALVGIALGLVIAAAVTRLLAAQLYGVSPTDLPTFALVGIGVAVAAWLSSLIPALRATRVDPLVALRS